MQRNKIFLSYRRDDSPGYVSRLERELEQAFGKDRVFRDANDIRGGAKWKDVIEKSLCQSVVLLLIVGPRWEHIWESRKNDKVNYVALELERARELGVTVVPVSLDGVILSKDIDLGDVSWILDSQFHDLSDRQGRWEGDFGRLIRVLEDVDGIGAARIAHSETPEPTPKKSGSVVLKIIAIGVGLFTLAVIWSGMSETEDVTSQKNRDEPIFVNTGKNSNTDILRDNRDAAISVGSGAKEVPAVPDVPNIGGTWQGLDGTYYYIQQHTDGSFDIQSPDYASGRGQFYTDRPRKFMIEMFGIGRGEFSVSANDKKIIGWLEVNGQQEYDTLLRVN